ncbi:SAM-dependent methyltransferase [Chromatium okenii]|uniref:class I SAM-dependent DNA methyltransferase n=1 Tax=Chromatium okenii TaxID=61644 RepID=UPI001902F63D|nr:class I SAM-dependent DNA methyltransferase [Chromatium okenii]MBK1641668.1 SAM-dependent methyltransferase [Chromatium okenii]
MPLSWNEIKDRALHFSREWADDCSEDAEAKSFWDGFFNIFGVSRRRLASFEQRVKQIDGRAGYIDLLWKGKLLVEHKSRGKNLDRAHAQATDYFHGLKDRELPHYVLVCDFARFRLYDLDADTQHEFQLAELVNHVHLFGFMAGYQTTAIQEQDPINVKAAERMGLLHDQLKTSGYVGHALEVYLVRLVFCLFAEHTGIFEVNQFQELIEQRTAEDGQDLAHWLAHCFEVLNTPEGKRLTRLDPQLAAFPYINGHLFTELLPIAAFDREMRDLLLECCALNWERISPAIFGALFQSVMNPDERRQLGAHYTSETNILKLIQPLFLDDLRAEFERIKSNKKKLFVFQQKLASLKFLDPACGCGNFLVIAYRELRLLELEVLRALFSDARDLSIGVGEFNILCNVNQFYGIEIEEFPAQIAQTALWLTDHQMNRVASQEFGINYLRIPLTHSATIRHGNALQIDWRDLVPPAALNYILGNPPFVGSKYMSDSQRAEVASIFYAVKGAGILDFVSAWYRKATDYMTDNPTIKTAFVATNSITQGEQVGVLWSDLLKRGVKIHFAHRTFQWSSEAKGKAAVHCVIIGFSLFEPTNKQLFDYETVQSKEVDIKAKNINPYLVDASDAVISKRNKPICNVPEIGIGNKPIDGGNYLFTTEERDEFIKREPAAATYFRRWLGSDEFINGYERWCLWLGKCPPTQLQKMPEAMKRVHAVQRFRLASKSKPTIKLADTPTRFHVENMPNNSFLLIPRVSSERRKYIPLGFIDSKTLVSDAVLLISDATLYHFGVLTSAMHMAWMRTVCGRLKSDYRYSASIVYNNFPWPEKITDKQRNKIEQAAQAVLDARANASLAALYDPLTMPVELVKAHRQLDRAVDAAYSKQKFSGDAERVAFLFERYQQLTAPLAPQKPQRRKKLTPSS